jgi:hypothetical protein
LSVKDYFTAGENRGSALFRGGRDWSNQASAAIAETRFDQIGLMPTMGAFERRHHVFESVSTLSLRELRISHTPDATC